MQVCYLWLANTLKRVRRLLGNKETQKLKALLQEYNACQFAAGYMQWWNSLTFTSEISDSDNAALTFM